MNEYALKNIYQQISTYLPPYPRVNHLWSHCTLFCFCMINTVGQNDVYKVRQVFRGKNKRRIPLRPKTSPETMHLIIFYEISLCA